jgi:hypothetical protein
MPVYGKVQRVGYKKRGALRKMEGVIRTVLTDEDHGDATFGVITKNLGSNTLLVCKTDKKEVPAKIYSKILRAAKCWTPGTLVVLAPGNQKGEFEVEAMLERKDAKQLVKDNVIPTWLMNMSDGVDHSATEDAGFDFEEEENEDEEATAGATATAKAPKRGSKEAVMAAKARERLEADDEDVDIDNI